MSHVTLRKFCRRFVLACPSVSILKHVFQSIFRTVIRSAAQTKVDSDSLPSRAASIGSTLVRGLRHVGVKQQYWCGFRRELRTVYVFSFPKRTSGDNGQPANAFVSFAYLLLLFL